MPTVTGDVKTVAGSAVTSGEVRFRSTQPIVQNRTLQTTTLATDAAEYKAPLNSSGTFSVDLPASGDGWAYEAEIVAYVGSNRVKGLPKLVLEVPELGTDLAEAGVLGQRAGNVIIRKMALMAEIGETVAAADNAVTVSNTALSTANNAKGTADLAFQRVDAAHVRMNSVEDTADAAYAYVQTIAAGESAYEVAVRNGFVGTEVEWLASLPGATGAQMVDNGDGTYTFGS